MPQCNREGRVQISVQSEDIREKFKFTSLLRNCMPRSHAGRVCSRCQTHSSTAYDSDVVQRDRVGCCDRTPCTLTCHRKCATAVQVLKDNFSWITTECVQWSIALWMIGKSSTSVGCSNCVCARTTSGAYHVFHGEAVAQWWEVFMEFTFLE